MSLRPCATHGCEHQVREGLVRPSYERGVHGQELADGVFCWRCRRKQVARDRPTLVAPKKPAQQRSVSHHQNSRRFKCECGRVYEWRRFEDGTPERDHTCECGTVHWR